MKRKRQIAVVLGVLTNGRGKFLIDLRSDIDRPEHNRWELPGGKVEFGEDPTVALKREMHEEIGVEVAIVTLLPKIYTNIWHYEKEDVQVLLIGYLCTIVRGEAKPSNEEVADIKWITPSEIRSFSFLPFADTLLADAAECLETTSQ